jgi:hypothetical protein
MANSTYMKNAVLDAFFGAGAITMSLHTADPGVSGANEVSGGLYARQAVTYGAAASGEIKNTATATFAGLPACTVTHAGFWKNGQFCQGAALTAARTVLAGDGLYFSAENIAHLAN